MKFAVERDALLLALGHAHRIVAKTEAIPILTTALFAAAGDRLAITATNTEMVAETSCRAEIETEGTAAIRVGLLADILRKLPAGTALRFEREAETGQLAMRYRRSRVVLPTLSPEDFAPFGITESEVQVQLEGPALARLLSVPGWVASADHAYAFACGIHLHFDEGDSTLVGVAVDTIVLSKVGATCDGARDLPPVTVPLRSCAEIVKLAQAAGGDTVTLRVTDRLLSAQAGGTTLTTKLVDCTFPDYRSIVPADPQPCASASSGDLAAALDRVRLLASDEHQTVSFQVADGALTIAARSPAGGEISETIEVEGGDGIRFSVKARFAVEALNAVGADLIHLAGGALGAPIVVRPASGGDALAMIMPLRA